MVVYYGHGVEVTSFALGVSADYIRVFKLRFFVDSDPVFLMTVNELYGVIYDVILRLGIVPFKLKVAFSIWFLLILFPKLRYAIYNILNGKDYWL